MKRLRIFAEIAPFWKPCIYANDHTESDPFVTAVKKVCQLVSRLTYTLT